MCDIVFGHRRTSRPTGGPVQTHILQHLSHVEEIVIYYVLLMSIYLYALVSLWGEVKYVRHSAIGGSTKWPEKKARLQECQRASAHHVSCVPGQPDHGIGSMPPVLQTRQTELVGLGYVLQHTTHMSVKESTTMYCT